jgi:hypothetical protein
MLLTCEAPFGARVSFEPFVFDRSAAVDAHAVAAGSNARLRCNDIAHFAYVPDDLGFGDIA